MLAHPQLLATHMRPAARSLLSFGTVALVLACLAGARAMVPPGAPPDHFLAYKTKRAKGASKVAVVPAIRLVDRFEDRRHDAVDAADLLVPAAVDGGAIANDAIHLQAYALKLAKVCTDSGAPCASADTCGSGAKCKRPAVVKRAGEVLVDPFGVRVLNLGKADRLLVPSTKSLTTIPDAPEAANHTVDHYKCYQAKLAKGAAGPAKGTELLLADQLTPAKRFVLKKLTHLCTPVDKNGEGIETPTGHLLCYGVKGAKGEAKHVKRAGVGVNNQFGPLARDTSGEREVCVPAAPPVVGPTPTPTPTGGASGTTPTPTPTATGSPGLPPDPAGIAPTVAPGLGTAVFGSTAFLYSGPNAIQTGVAPGTIVLERAAVIRGRVFAHDGGPLPGVTVRILDHPELGQTQSRADGGYDLAVNGGRLTVTYAKAGLLPAQRQLDVPWQDWITAPDVMLIPLDAAVTTVVMEHDAAQVARGSETTDADGTRRATLIVPPGTGATMEMPGGGTQVMGALAVRATEYTVGADGPMAMPAALPPTSGYTYAVELSADEAIAAGASRVAFDQPLPYYVENFLGFPTGTWVPSGFYDHGAGRWEAGDSGRVVEILSETGDLADVDVDGDRLPEDAAGYTAAGITDAERAQLALLYAPGQTLWRVPITHFTPWDFNFPYGPPPDSGPPCPTCGPRPPDKKPPKDPCERGGSIVQCQGQVLGETVALTGVPFALHYRSDRVPGRRESSALEIQLTGATVPPPLQAVKLEIAVAGRVFKETFPAQPNLTYTFTWDGKDAYGRAVNGRQRASVRIGYEYVAEYFTTSSAFAESFTRFGSPPISRGVFAGGGGGGGGGSAVFDIARVQARNTAPPITLTEIYEAVVGGALDPRAQSVGGWTLGVHHVYDVVGRELLLGNGARRSTDGADDRIDTRAGAGINASEGISAAETRIPGRADGLAVSPDGSLYFTESEFRRVRRIDREGIVTTVAGTSAACSTVQTCGDGGPATQAQLTDPTGLAVAPDGTLYIADASLGRIRRIGTDGIITTVGGTFSLDFSFNGDGLPATQTRLRAADVALGPDGSLYFGHVSTGRLRRIGPDGIVTTVAGPGSGTTCNTSTAPCGDGGLATEAGLFDPRGLAVGPDGSVYVSTFQNRVRRIGPDGIITTVAGTGNTCPATTNACGDGGPATAATFVSVNRLAVGPDGTLFIGDVGRVRAVGKDGVIRSVAGSGVVGQTGAGDGGFARAAVVPGVMGLTVAPDGRLYVSHGQGFDNRSRIRIVQPLLPGAAAGEIGIPDEDGREIWVFDGAGLHLRTLDALTGATILQFGYDAANRLLTITDADANVTTIERAGDGAPTAIVAPGGQRTTLAVDAAGYLVSVTNPASQAFTMTYGTGTAEGLLATFTDPRNQTSRFTYDADGLLIRDQGPDGTDQTLARTELGDGHYEVALTTAEGLTTTYEVELLPTNDVVRTRTDPGGDQTIALVRTDGTREVTYPDGTVATLVAGPDPRFGVLAPILASLTITTPGGITATRTATRTVTLADPLDPLSLVTQTDTIVQNGETSTQVYDAAARTLTTTTPEGRTFQTTLDAVGRPVEQEIDPGGAVLPVTFSYDQRGRLATASHGAQSWTWTYDAKNRPVARTDAAGDSRVADYDDADRRIAASLPSDRDYGFARDADGNLTGLTMPSLDVHGVGYTPANLLASYTPPGNAAYTTTYDDDRRVRTITLPSGRTETFTYDAANRLASIAHPEATATFSYGAGGRIAQLTRTPAAGSAQTVAFGYDANLPVTATWTGAATATFAYDWNADFRLASMAVTSGVDDVTTTYVRDGDGLVTALGPLTFDRGGPGGVPTAVADGTATWSYAYDPLGRIASRTLSVGGTAKYAVAFTYDTVGRIGRRVETIGGVAVTWDYGYDADSQLVEVRRDDDVVETYAYDPNRNRTSRTLGGGAPQAATFDDQDRIVEQGAVTYATNADGYVVQRGADTFTYATTGELLQATAGGQTVTYAYDAVRRRVSRTVAGVTTQYLYGNPDQPFQVTHTRDAGGTFTTYYYDDGGRLLAFARGGTRYYVGVDQVGSPIVVADGTGTLVKVREYDAFGTQVSDSAPAFELALGFAGGLGDVATGLVRFGWRDYDPASGRWMSRDPALYEGRQANLYAYVSNSPVNLVDPVGLFSFEASAYEGLGAGLKIGIDKDGISACVEVGVGIGSSVEVDALDGTDNSSLGLVAEGEVKLGPGRLKGKLELLRDYGPGKFGDCPPTTEGKAEAKLCIGPVCGGAEGSTREGVEPRFGDDFAKGNIDPTSLAKSKLGAGTQLKLAAKSCARTSF